MRLLGQVTLREELSIAEAITVASGAALIFAVIYNLGYFSLLNTSFASLLTPQDLLIGAAIAFVPSAFLLEVSVRMDRWVHDGEKTSRKVVVMVMLVLLLIVMLVSVFIFKNAATTTFVLAAINALAVGGYVLDILGKNNHGVLYAVTASTAWAVIYQLGTGFFESSLSGYSKPEYEVVTTDKTYSGRIIRETTNFTFLFDGTSVVALPNSSVQSLKKLQILGVQ